MRTREGMKVAKAKGRLRGKEPKLKPNQIKHLLLLYNEGTYNQTELLSVWLTPDVPYGLVTRAGMWIRRGWGFCRSVARARLA